MSHRKTISMLITVALIGLCISRWPGAVRAEDLYVSAAATSNGNGTAVKPYWRITDAVVRARSDRLNHLLPPAETITIHVAPGVYAGSYADSGGRAEQLPIVINVPNLTLAGATTLAVDAAGLPTGIAKGTSESVLTTKERSASHSKTLIAVIRTTDGGAGDNVAISGLTIDEPNSKDNLGNAVWVEHVSGFAIRRNLMRHHASAIYTRLGSGVIAGNLLIDNFGPGAYTAGGSLAYPAAVTISGNRMTGDEQGLFVGANIDNFAINLGTNNLSSLPLRLDGSRVNAPAGLDVGITGNDLSGNGANGLRILMAPALGRLDYIPPAPGVPTLTAAISGNAIDGNSGFGIALDAGNSPRGNYLFGPYSGTFQGTFGGNQLLGNRLGVALVTFTSSWPEVDGESPADFAYLQQAVYCVTDVDGELAGFEYDNPATDPLDGTALNNTLIVNGGAIPAGTNITP